MAQPTPDTLPDHHFLLIAPNLGADWLFVAARQYWGRFQPTVISDGELVALTPPEETVAVSILAGRDIFERMAVAVASGRNDALLDALVYRSVTEAQTALDARARLNQPFGVPLAPTPIPPTREVIQPTPGSVLGGGGVAPAPTVTPNASGFVTQVPTAPAGFITQTPSPTPQDDNDTRINPTPGAITGGG